MTSNYFKKFLEMKNELTIGTVQYFVSYCAGDYGQFKNVKVILEQSTENLKQKTSIKLSENCGTLSIFLLYI